MLDYGFDMSGVELEVALPDLVSEGYELDALISAQADWSRETPAAGWTIAHQIAHLASADQNVLIAIRTPEAFDAVLKHAAVEGPRYRDLDAAEGAAKPRAELLQQWRSGRIEVAAALRDLAPGQAFPWYDSHLTAALMVPLRLLGPRGRRATNPRHRPRLLPPRHPTPPPDRNHPHRRRHRRPPLARNRPHLPLTRVCG